MALTHPSLSWARSNVWSLLSMEAAIRIRGLEPISLPTPDPQYSPPEPGRPPNGLTP